MKIGENPEIESLILVEGELLRANFTLKKYLTRAVVNKSLTLDKYFDDQPGTSKPCMKYIAAALSTIIPVMI